MIRHGVVVGGVDEHWYWWWVVWHKWVLLVHLHGKSQKLFSKDASMTNCFRYFVYVYIIITSPLHLINNIIPQPIKI